MYFNPRNKEIEKIFDRLMNYPVLRVDPIKAQAISRYKQIRHLNHNRSDPLIYINKGIVGLNPRITIKKRDIGFDIDIF